MRSRRVFAAALFVASLLAAGVSGAAISASANAAAPPSAAATTPSGGMMAATTGRASDMAGMMTSMGSAQMDAMHEAMWPFHAQLPNRPAEVCDEARRAMVDASDGVPATTVASAGHAAHHLSAPKQSDLPNTEE